MSIYYHRPACVYESSYVPSYTTTTYVTPATTYVAPVYTPTYSYYNPYRYSSYYYTPRVEYVPRVEATTTTTTTYHTPAARAYTFRTLYDRYRDVHPTYTWRNTVLPLYSRYYNRYPEDVVVEEEEYLTPSRKRTVTKDYLTGTTKVTYSPA